MKIRIKGNSLRLRLSQTELKNFHTNKQCKDQIHFSKMHCLEYILSIAENFSAEYLNNSIRIGIPEKIANRWIDTDEVSIAHEIYIDESKTLKLLIEKDFQCLTVREGEDESDNFPNPNTHC